MQRPWIVPTPGTRLERLEENIGAVGVELTPEDLQEIERGCEHHGTRRPVSRTNFGGV
jgi:aryl-alcohol dehydrogenase-like predicted oxidoreductase